jgi:DNA-binding protein YbaB
MDKDDPEMLEDLLLVAINEGLRQIEEMSQANMGKLTGGLNLPPGLL